MSTAADPGRPERHADPRQPLGDIVSGLTETLSKLMRQEVALAKAETKQEVSTAARAVGMFAGAGVFALVALILLSLSIGRWLAEYMDLGWAYLIVTVAWVAVAAGLVATGRRSCARSARCLSGPPKPSARSHKQ